MTLCQDDNNKIFRHLPRPLIFIWPAHTCTASTQLLTLNTVVPHHALGTKPTLHYYYSAAAPPPPQSIYGQSHYKENRLIDRLQIDKSTNKHTCTHTGHVTRDSAAQRGGISFLSVKLNSSAPPHCIQHPPHRSKVNEWCVSVQTEEVRHRSKGFRPSIGRPTREESPGWPTVLVVCRSRGPSEEDCTAPRIT